MCNVMMEARSLYLFKLHWFMCWVYSDAFFTLLKILIEVDHLQGVATPYLQIKGTNKDIVSSAGSALSLDGSYTTKVWLGIGGSPQSMHEKHRLIHNLFPVFIQFHGSLLLCRAIFKSFWRTYQLRIVSLLAFTISKLQGCRSWLSSSNHKYVCYRFLCTLIFLYTVLGTFLDAVVIIVCTELPYCFN